MTIIAGQPLDIQTIIDTVNTVNGLVSRQGKEATDSSVTGQDKVTNTYSTTSLSIQAANVSLDKVEATADIVTFSHSFAIAYQKPPVVTATLFHTANSSVVQDHAVVITNTTTQNVSGYVKFQASGSIANTSVNIIAIGVPGAV